MRVQVQRIACAPQPPLPLTHAHTYDTRAQTKCHSSPPPRHSAARATVLATVLTLFRLFDIPVFWPILVVYFCALFAMTMKTRIQEMIKHKYVPFAWGKKKYAAGGKGKKGDDRDGHMYGPPAGGGGFGGSSGFAAAGARPLGAPEPRFTSHGIK